LLIFLSFTLLNAQTAEDYLDSAKTKLDSKNYSRAIQDYNKAIELNPNLATAYYQCAFELFKGHHYN